jgi:transketolase
MNDTIHRLQDIARLIRIGIVWEAAMSAKKYEAGRLIVFVDNNGIQSGGPVDQVSGLNPILPKWEAFGWHCQEIDGAGQGPRTSGLWS